MGPHYARTIDIVRDIAEEDWTYMGEIVHPVHVTLASEDTVLDNSKIRKFFENIKTDPSLKKMDEYVSDHYILSDGWLY